MTLHRFVLALPGLAVGLVLGLALGPLFGLVPDLVPGAAAAEAAKPPEPFSPTLIFYVAKGGPDACGQGCDTWIAAEGRIDGDAAARLRKFFRQHKDQRLPIYFHSPGGNVEQALAMGRMLRNDKAVARVGRTLVKGCAPGLQIEDACLKLKQAGGQIDAEIATRGAMCNSACPFVLFGAATREIAPDASLAIHSPRLTLTFLHGRPSEALRAEAMRRALERADRNTSKYVAEMGIDRGLLDLQRTIKFEDRHILTRDEIFRFGIDRREFVETSWSLETGTRAFLRKLAAEKQDGKTSYRLLQWQLSCVAADDFRLNYRRQVEGSGTYGMVSMSGVTPKPLQFRFPPFKSPGYENWQLRMTKASVEALAGLPQLDITETSMAPDGQRLVHVAKLSTAGLAAAMKTLLGGCTVPTIGNDWWRAAIDLKKQSVAPKQDRTPEQEPTPKQETAPKESSPDQ